MAVENTSAIFLRYASGLVLATDLLAAFMRGGDFIRGFPRSRQKYGRITYEPSALQPQDNAPAGHAYCDRFLIARDALDLPQGRKLFLHLSCNTDVIPARQGCDGLAG
jgi:hypothetical protein